MRCDCPRFAGESGDRAEAAVMPGRGCGRGRGPFQRQGDG